uniref:Uncharacterized protein n=1 Tax=Clastoptera arizonana TaxID=38151 RepID=A0A1B6CIJ2_9HEMI
MVKAVLLLVVVSVVACAKAAENNKFDSIDVDRVLASRRLVTNYVGCLLEKKPCPPEGAELKRVLPEAIKTYCEKCTPNQKQKAFKAIRKLRNDYPQEWKQLSAKWDPSGEFTKKFDADEKKNKN